MAVKARWDHTHGEVGLLRKWRLGWARLFGGSLGELREGESPSGEEMARMVQEGLPPGSQSMPTSRPLRSPPPVPRALVGLKAADPVTSNRQKPVLTPWDGPEQRPGAGGEWGGVTTRYARGVVLPQLGFGRDSGSATPTWARALPPRLPVPAARLLLAGAAPAWAEVPRGVPRAPRLRPLLLLVLQLLYVLGLLDGDADLHRSLGPRQRLLAGLGHGSRAGRVCGAAGSPRREAEPAGLGLLRRGGGGDASGSAPEGRGSRRPAPRRRCHHPDGLPSARADGVA